MTVREELHVLVDALTEEDAAEALDYLRPRTADGEALSEREFEIVREGEEEIARGEYVTLSELTRSLRE
jgi:hypothetical protein